MLNMANLQQNICMVAVIILSNLLILRQVLKYYTNMIALYILILKRLYEHHISCKFEYNFIFYNRRRS